MIGSNFNILSIVLSIPAILIAFTFHEYARAVVADRLGDKTPRFQGRLTFNPIAHIDPIGFVLILIFGFGWSKGVQTNPSAYKNPHKDDLKVAIAGPCANFLIGIIFAFVTVILAKVFASESEVFEIIIEIASIVSLLNFRFFILNLIPLPGFDGFRILRDLFPKTFYNISDSLYRYQMIIFIALAMPILGGNSILGYIIGVPSNMMYAGFLNIANMIIR